MKQSYILFSFAFDREGKAQKLSNEKVAEELRNEGLAWVHLDANQKSTKKWLEREVSYLDHLIIDALVAEEARPRIIEFHSGALIILRGVNLNKDDEPEDMVSIRVWIDSGRIITVQRRNLKSVFDLKNQLEIGKTIKNSSEFLYNLLYQTLSITSPFLYGLIERLDSLEEKVMNTHNIEFREKILQIRTQSAIFKRYLVPQKEVIAKLRNSEYLWIDDWSKRHFQENLNQITHLIEEIGEAWDRSQILHEELANAIAEKLNKNMYKLSVITSIFMPLTFITGLFGMNVRGIPGSNYHYAFYICSVMMLLLAWLHFLFFKKKDWF